MEKKRLKVVCDCDMVLLNFSAGFVPWHNEKYSDYQLVENPTEYSYGLPEAILWDRINEFWKTDNISKLPPCGDDVIDQFKILNNEHDVYIVSCVPTYLYKARLENLKDFEIEPHKLILDQNKIQYIKTMNPDICIEDSPINIKMLNDADLPVFYPSYWNYIKDDVRNHSTSVIGYNNWKELNSMIFEISNNFS